MYRSAEFEGDCAATSAIDHDTDAIIQSTLRNELGSDVTVITVAHRLQTIMDNDKIVGLLHLFDPYLTDSTSRWSWMLVELSSLTNPPSF